MSRKIMLIAGARPNFVKVAPLYQAFRRAGFDNVLVHTGQHYDTAMSQVFFDQLGLPSPDHNLGVGSGAHGAQTGRIMMLFEPVLLETRPDAMIVVGDVNSTVACALVAAKAVYPDGGRSLVVHVEAGLRSNDWTMPEEINRVVTDNLSDVLFASEPSGVENLIREGVAESKVHLVGNVMIDTLFRLKEQAAQSDKVSELGLDGTRFGLVTLHRPANVDEPARLGALLEALHEISRDLPLLLAAHPRTIKAIENHGLDPLQPPSRTWARDGGMALCQALPYMDFLGLMQKSTVVLTDSGGVQEETTALGVPCLTLRPNTERPVTISQGTNRLVPDPEGIKSALGEALAGRAEVRVPDLWDGRAAERIAAIMANRLDG